MTATAPALGVANEVHALCSGVEGSGLPSALTEQITEIRSRLEGPLRIAIAGRVKAGKSTLLNALVGERLAPTDAGECTKIVTWYRRGSGYEVSARMTTGDARPLTFRRTNGALDVDLEGLSPELVEALDVRWPASSLEEVTLIDTPGLASINDENSVRSRRFLDGDAEQPSDADAVIYLMRHIHKSDVEFLDAFMDRSVPGASPVNAVGVLSRADEIGAARLDAIESAARIAARYRDDPTVRALCSTVVPIAGLLAETGITLREDEATDLRTLASTEPAELEQMLLSADHFCDLHASDLTVEIRRDLLDRLGLYGVRFALQELREGRVSNASQLAPALVERSGLADLRRLITDHFMPRARVLQARAALVALRALAPDVAAADPSVGEKLRRESERIEASATEFAQLRVAHLVLSGAVNVTPSERSEIERVVLASAPTTSLGIPADSSPAQIKDAALAGINRWRVRGSDPLADPALVETCETVARAYEAIFASVA